VRDKLSARVRRRLERALLITGVTCLGYYGYQIAEAHHFQREQTAAFEAMLESKTVAPPVRAELPRDVRSVSPSVHRAAPAASVGDAATSKGTIGVGSGVMALVEIPRLKLSGPIMSGDDEATLDVAVGHLPDTPKPWEAGNSALAAHRDGLFRPLRNIRVGDDVRVRTEFGDFSYRVRETKIVMPDDVSVLAPTDGHTLTLITCYPFNFIGHAPKRFIVHADRVE
jgi:sortase A